MSDLHRDPDADWALASAYLDDDVDATERATVEGDPALLALVERLRGVRTALATPVTTSTVTRDAGIAAALAAFDQPSTATTDTATTDTATTDTVPSAVTRLDERRARRLRWISGGAAAAIVLVAVGIVVGNRDSSSNDAAVSKAPATTFAAATTSADASRQIVNGGQEAGGAPATTAAGAAATTTGAAAETAAASADAAGTAPAPSGAATYLFDQPEQLLELPVPDTASAPTQAGAADSTTAATSPSTVPPTALTSSIPCQAVGETVLAIIVYRGTPAVATLDVVAHVRRARSTVDCSILATVADNP